jgi:hopene-associated glycosyltransferase HpnB
MMPPPTTTTSALAGSVIGGEHTAVAGSPFVLALAVAGGVSALVWLAVLLDPARARDLRPVGEEEPEPPDPGEWPPVAVVVPARNEAGLLPHTLPALLCQDYPGRWETILVDDRSGDGTARAAAGLAKAGDRLVVVTGAPLPPGWVGKVWALQQGYEEAVRRAGRPIEYVLLTDADIRHVPTSLRRLVAESEAGGLALNSRMARLRAQARAERLLIPPFVFFFNLLYPMRRVNDPRSRVAAAAGGCMLVRRDALERSGGLTAIRSAIIDDVSLARRMKALGERVRLATSRSDVVSIREYGSVAPIWRMVRRTAFDELRFSWLRLAATLVVLAVLFPLPPSLVVLAAVLGAAGDASPAEALAVGLAGGVAWALMTVAYLRATRLYGLSLPWALTLPLAGLLYGGMTLDSARLHLQRKRGAW